MIKKILFNGLLVLIVLVLVSCSSSNPAANNPASIENISAEMLNTMLEERPGEFILVNIHHPFVAMIPGTDLLIPYHQLIENQDQLPADKSTEIVLYCLNDPTSTRAAAFLVSQGYTNVKNLVGGLNGWHSAGLPLEFEP